jgi:pilus assembly protein FimV
LVFIRIFMLKSSQAALKRAVHPLRQVVRQWCVAAAATSLFYSALAPALGLGDITLHSALDQPFNADIELVETAGLSADDIVASLASPEAFSRAGIERLFFFNDLRFTPVIHGNHGMVHVESRKPVTEPYLNFLVRLVRPNGDVLHAYTVLLDPPNSAIGAAASRSRRADPSSQRSAESRMPVAPPQAVQGNRYTVASGDNLGTIARRLQGPGSKTSASELARGIEALNPQAFPSGNSTRLKVGQSLLLPDSAVLPRSTVVPSVAAVAQTTPPPSAASADGLQQNAEQLASTVIENQQLTKTVGDLKGQMQALQGQLSGKDKQLTELNAALAELKLSTTKVVTPVVPPVAVTPSAVPASPVTEAPAEESSGNMLLLGAVLVLLLLLALAYSVRRKRLINAQPVQNIVDTRAPRPAIAAAVPVVEKPSVVTASTALVVAVPTPGTHRLAGAATDAMDGASIYIAYGRISEALGILRDALQKQPQRTDLRLRILELLAQQGDADGFAGEEQAALDQGVSADKLQEIRAQHPQLFATPSPAPVAIPLPSSEPVLPEAVVNEAVVSSLSTQPADEFQLNLEDLSMDADWDLVDPFETTPAVRSKGQPEQPPTADLDFASNLTELPEVFEIPDEQFLSDFSEPEPTLHANSDSLDDAFLEGFMDDSAGFDMLDLSDEPLSKINQAQVLIDDGDLQSARELLLEVINETDDNQQQTARDLLAGIS